MITELLSRLSEPLKPSEDWISSPLGTRHPNALGISTSEYLELVRDIPYNVLTLDVVRSNATLHAKWEDVEKATEAVIVEHQHLKTPPLSSRRLSDAEPVDVMEIQNSFLPVEDQRNHRHFDHPWLDDTPSNLPSDPIGDYTIAGSRRYVQLADSLRCQVWEVGSKSSKPSLATLRADSGFEEGTNNVLESVLPWVVDPADVGRMKQSYLTLSREDQDVMDDMEQALPQIVDPHFARRFHSTVTVVIDEDGLDGGYGQVLSAMIREEVQDTWTKAAQDFESTKDAKEQVYTWNDPQGHRIDPNMAPSSPYISIDTPESLLPIPAPNTSQGAFSKPPPPRVCPPVVYLKGGLRALKRDYPELVIQRNFGFHFEDIVPEPFVDPDDVQLPQKVDVILASQGEVDHVDNQGFVDGEVEVISTPAIHHGKSSHLVSLHTDLDFGSGPDTDASQPFYSLTLGFAHALRVHQSRLVDAVWYGGRGGHHPAPDPSHPHAHPSHPMRNLDAPIRIADHLFLSSFPGSHPWYLKGNFSKPSSEHSRTPFQVDVKHVLRLGSFPKDCTLEEVRLDENGNCWTCQAHGLGPLGGHSDPLVDKLTQIGSGHMPYPFQFFYNNQMQYCIPKDVNIRYYELEVEDSETPFGLGLMSEEIVGKGVAMCSEAKERGESILVHCHAGVSRSATIVLASLMKEYHVPLRQAFEWCFFRRPIVRPNEGFCRLLQAWEATLRQQGEIEWFNKHQVPQLPSIPRFWMSSSYLNYMDLLELRARVNLVEKRRVK